MKTIDQGNAMVELGGNYFKMPEIKYKEALENMMNGEIKDNFAIFVHGLLKDLVDNRIHLEGCSGEIIKAHHLIVDLETAQLKDFESKYRRKRKEWRAERHRLEAAEDELKKQLDDVKVQESDLESVLDEKLKVLVHQEKVLDKKLKEFSSFIGVEAVASVDRAREVQRHQLDQYIQHINKITIDAGILEDLSIVDIQKRMEDQILRSQYFHRIEIFLEKYRLLVEMQSVQFEKFAALQIPDFVADYQEQYLTDQNHQIYSKLKTVMDSNDSISGKVGRAKKIIGDYSSYDYKMPPYFTRDFFSNLGGELSGRHTMPVIEYLRIYIPIFETVEIVLRHMKNSSDKQVRESYYALFFRYFKPGLVSIGEQRQSFAALTQYNGKTQSALNRLFYRKVKYGLEVFSQYFWFLMNPENGCEEDLRDIFDQIVEIIQSDHAMNPEAYLEKARELAAKKFSEKE